MEVIFKILTVVFVLYGYFLLRLAYGCGKLKSFTTTPDSLPKNKFSVVVPFRNEKENLSRLLSSFEKLYYPKEMFEVLLVDDFSDDGFQASGANFQLSAIQNNRKTASPKKDAICTAIKKAKYDWIITTDADCEVSEKWLLTLDNFIQKNLKTEMVCGMVLTYSNGSFFQDFQKLDFMSLQSTTIGSFGMGNPFMCNGANFAYKKSLFQSLNGFSGNENIAGGDDVFMLQKAVKNYTERVSFLKSQDYLVMTRAAESWKALFFQRVRWASKTKAYTSLYAKTLAVMVFFGNFGFIIALFLTLSDPKYLFFIGFKIVIDRLLIGQTKRFSDKLGGITYLFSSVFYPFFCVAVAVYSLFGKYSWKGRKF